MGIDISVIWFVIIVFATLMYIIMDGFDLGIGIVFSFVPSANDSAHRHVNWPDLSRRRLRISF